MSISSSPLLWLAVILAAAIILMLVRSRRRERLDRDEIVREAREAAREAAERSVQEVAPEVVQDASAAAVRAYQERENAIREEQAERRRESAARAKDTKMRKIAELQTWRPTFVAFVRKLAEPFFAEWRLDEAQLDDWAEERADVYIRRKPYVLEIIQSIHADAQRSAESLANRSGKSAREIARERAKGTANSLDRNSHCPYCGDQLDARTQLDHIIPVQRGGPSEPWNTVFVCVPCNRAKRDYSLMEFLDTDYARQRRFRAGDIAKRLRDLDKYVEVLR